MRRLSGFAVFCAVLVAVVSAGAAAAFGSDVQLNAGSPLGWFSHNKQNEPGLAVDQAHPQFVAAGSNDEIDVEDCNVGDPTTCPFTPGVGVSGVYLSTNGGGSFVQPTYQGWTTRQCNNDPRNAVCPGAVGPIGTLPRYYESGLVSDGDPALAFGPQPDGRGGFSYANGSRLYYVNLASNFSSQKRDETFKGAEAIAVSRLDTQNFGRAIAGDSSAWAAPVIASKQSSTTFSDKEAAWADNAQSSPYFGNFYVCNTSFRSNGSGAEPILFTRSTDGGATFDGPRQLTAATDNNQTGGRQSCAIRTDSQGVVYVYYEGFDKQSGQNVFFQVRSNNGGVNFDRPHIVAQIAECGLPDPNTGRFSFDGVGGARTDSFPSVDLANGAPSGNGATNEIVMAWCNGPTPSVTTANSVANEQARIQYSTNGGNTFTAAGSASPTTDRPNFPAIAISPDGTDVYVTYDNFLQPWQPTTADQRLMQGVVQHANVNAAGGVAPFAELFRAPTGDARGSSQNGKTAEFLGDYNYAAATNDAGIVAYNDVRGASDCSAIDQYRQSIADGNPIPPPSPELQCGLTFGNSDIFGGSFADPS